MNLPAGAQFVWHNVAHNAYVFKLPDGSYIAFSDSEMHQMTHPGLMSYTGLGGFHGGYRTPTQTTHGSSSNGTDPGNTGAQAQLAQHYAQTQAIAIAARQAAFANYNTYTGGMTILGNTFQQEPMKPLEYAGIKGGEIIAYRCWLIKGNPVSGYVLTSCYVEIPWHPNTPMTGDIGNPEYYHYGFGYGVHSFKTKKLAFEYGREYWSSYCAFGRVKLWGEVIEHEKGYRAENAKIMSIDQILNPKDDQRILRQLRKRYGVNEYANGNDTGKGQEGPGEGESAGTNNRIGRDDLPGTPRDSRKGKYWNYLRSFIHRRGV